MQRQARISIEGGALESQLKDHWQQRRHSKSAASSTLASHVLVVPRHLLADRVCLAAKVFDKCRVTFLYSRYAKS